MDRIKARALAHPAEGCNRHEAMLALAEVHVSSVTIQKILSENGLGTKVERWLALERQNAEKSIDVTAEQAAFLEKLNPCFRERHVESTSPGELLSADNDAGSISRAAPKALSARQISTPQSTPRRRAVCRLVPPPCRNMVIFLVPPDGLEPPTL